MQFYSARDARWVSINSGYSLDLTKIVKSNTGGYYGCNVSHQWGGNSRYYTEYYVHTVTANQINVSKYDTDTYNNGYPYFEIYIGNDMEAEIARVQYVTNACKTVTTNTGTYSLRQKTVNARGKISLITTSTLTQATPLSYIRFNF